LATAYNAPARRSADLSSGTVATYFHQLAELVPRLPYDAVDQIVGALFQAIEEERTVFVFGNGGSATAASHMMCDINKGTREQGTSRRPRVLALTDNVALLTAWANDRGFDQVFSEQMKTFVRQGDVAFAISASGNSPNVVRGLRTARQRGAFTAGISGFQGGRMRQLCDLCAVVPSDNMQLIEDMHQAMLHSIFTVLRDKLRASRRSRLTVAAAAAPS
jgi:D-sedoheptulose 7-phosphate isomerase